MMNDIIIQGFSDVEYIPFEKVGDQSDLRDVKQLQVGFGSKVFRVDQDGMWAGAERFADAPWSVDWLGNMVATSLDLSGYLEIGEALSDIGLGNITGTYIASGAITTSKLSATAIDGMTITGALIRTSSSGGRVVMDDTTDSLMVYDTSGNKRMVLDNDELTFYNASEAERGGITTGTTEVYFHALNGGNLHLEAEGSLYTIIFTINAVQKGYFSGAGLTLNDNLNMDGNDITSVDRISGTAGYFDMTGATIRVDQEISPAVDNSEDLGDPSFIWNDIYVSDLNYSTLTLISDGRLKENVEPMEYGISAIMKLNPVFYTMKEKEVDISHEDAQRAQKRDPEKFAKSVEKARANIKKQSALRHLGFIAQEVQTAIPDIVDLREEDGIFTLRNTELIPVLVRAVQELNEHVSDLEEEVKTLKGG